MLREIAGQVGTVVLVAVLVSLVIGQALGQPVLLAYVESGSMEPTIDEGDGFVAIPSAVATTPQEGDVVTFRAEEIEGGGLTTHRIVDETPEGYITRGDANPFTDQDGGEPPVTEGDIVAKALQIGGYTVTIPHLGTGIEAVQGVLLAATTAVAGAFGLGAGLTAETVGFGLFGLGLVLFVASLVGERRGSPERDRRRSRRRSGQLDTRVIALAMVLVVLVPANAAMILPAGPTEITVDGDDVAEAEGVSAGDAVDAELTIRNDAFLTMVFTFESASEDVTIDREALSIPPGGETTVTASVPAPEPGTERTITVEERRYFLLGPESAITWLHDVRPLAAIGALNLFIGASVLGFVGGLFGFGPSRFRETDRGVPLSVRVKRQLRR